MTKKKDLLESITIIPEPVEISVKEGRFRFDKETKIVGEKNLEKLGQYLQQILSKVIGWNYQITRKR